MNPLDQVASPEELVKGMSEMELFKALPKMKTPLRNSERRVLRQEMPTSISNIIGIFLFLLVSLFEPFAEALSFDKIAPANFVALDLSFSDELVDVSSSEIALACSLTNGNEIIHSPLLLVYTCLLFKNYNIYYVNL
jgi:hypothetical protein